MSVYKKKALRFGDKNVFGTKFSPSVNKSLEKLSTILVMNKAYPTGMLVKDAIFETSDLWNYVYYLFYYNNIDIDYFAAMKDPVTGKASAELFYNVVKNVGTAFESLERIQGEKAYDTIIRLEDLTYDVRKQSPQKQMVTPLSNKTLISFIHYVVVRYGDDLVNPLFDYVKVLSQKTSTIAKMKGIKIVTGLDKDSVNIVFDEEGIKNADIKVTFVPDR